ncbi:hypothetical protein [Flavobacterium wongokense]|uniref:hypothetical protein n=1 Tax=Flavobacterium wongokense TaxID=2910674 RepID=UPI001F427712|nr:hypothetical protein [Flavobacterium sp. WG47]MCF6131565.1 hypothetical protein [Flavobacterium sp. WG47]
MKNLFAIIALIFSLSAFSQSEVKITPKKCMPKKGYHLRLEKVFDDSRCPEGVSCVWAGEVSAIIRVYKDRKFMESKTLKFNPKNTAENINWFSNYYSKKIKSVAVFPYPKNGVTVKAKKKFIGITFEN